MSSVAHTESCQSIIDHTKSRHTVMVEAQRTMNTGAKRIQKQKLFRTTHCCVKWYPGLHLADKVGLNDL